VRSTELVVRDRRGAVLRREPVGHQAAATWFPHLSDSYQAVTAPLLADVDGDGLDDVLVALAHWPLYPSLVVLWQPADSRPSRAVLINSGHVGDIRVHDVDGDGSPELLAVGLNNLLGMQSIAAVVDIERSWTATHASGATSPDLTPLTANGGGGGRHLHSYTMLGESRGRATIEAADRGGMGLRLGTGTVRLDADGNPDASPLWQRGAAPRRRFWDDCRDTQLRVATAPESAAVLVADLEARHTAVLSDAGHRDAALFLLSGSLADAGRPGEGARVLALAERGAETNRRIWRQRGELSLIAGRRAEARTLIERAIAARERGANPDDELTMLALDAATKGDRAQFDLSLRVWQGSHSAPPPEGHVSLQLLEAFFAGEWDDARSGAMRWSDAFFHWQALTAWAALEDGAPVAATLEAIRPIAERPEARDLCLLVRGRAAMMGGDPRAAADLAQQALLRLDTRARRSYESFIWQGLAHWLRGAALHDAGNPAAARADLEIAARRLPGTWLGRDARQRLATVAGGAVVR
jgi:hypothetical protein